MHSPTRQPQAATFPRNGVGCSAQRALTLAAAGWFPLLLVVAQMLRLEAAFARPSVPFEFLPGWARLAGLPADHGVTWVHLLSLGGTGLLLSWALFLEQAGARSPVEWARRRSGVLLGPALAILVLGIWSVDLGERSFRQQVLPFAVVVHAPLLAASYGIVASGLKQVRSMGVTGAILLLLPATIVACQLRFEFERPGMNEPDEAVCLWGSLPIALAVAVRLAIWARAEPPPGEPACAEAPVS